MNIPQYYKKITFWGLQVYGWLLFSLVIFLKVASTSDQLPLVFLFTILATLTGFTLTSLGRNYFKTINIVEKPFSIIILSAMTAGIIGGILSAALHAFIYPSIFEGYLILHPFPFLAMNHVFVGLLWVVVYMMLKFFQGTVTEFQRRKFADFDKEKALRNEEIALAEAQAHSKDLMAKTLILSKHNDTMEKILEELNKYAPEDYPASRKIQSIVEAAKHDQVEWDDFYFWFDQSNKDYFAKLSKKYTDLSTKELKICAYLKINLPTKEISALSKLQVGTIEQYRIKIRKKLNIQKSESLHDFLNNI